MFIKNNFVKLILISLSLSIVITGCGLKQGNPKAMRELKTPIVLTYWRVFDGPDNFTDIFNDYHRLHPNVSIKYRKLRYDEYEQALLEAWAEDRGPDIFTIHNSWVGKYKTKILPLPDNLNLPYVLEADKKGNVIKAGYRDIKTITPMEIKNKFVGVVYDDVVRKNEIYGLPLSVDTLALFYNRRLLDNAQISRAPQTWLEVKQAVKKLTLQNENGDIIQAGIALGTANNINRATDILSLLMMQNGAQMTTADGQRATFNLVSSYSDDKSYRPGVEALRFYTDFASPAKEIYTWNKDMPSATQAFIEGRLAMMLGYAYELPLIKTQGANLNLGTAEIPHINSNGTDALGNKINMASYWIETVAKKSKHKNYAWDFVQFMTSKDEAIKYLTHSHKPTALRSLIDQQLNNYDIRPFVNQVLTAKDWYHGRDAGAMEDIFRKMIVAVVEGKNTAQEVVDFAVSQINRTF